MGGVRAAWLVAFILLPVANAATAEAPAPGIVNPVDVSTPTTLYFHLLDPFNEIYVNTQKPDFSFFDGGGAGVNTHSMSCLEDVPAGTITNYHHYFAVSSPSYVFYGEDYLSNGKPRVHPERRLPWDIRPDEQAPFQLHWFMQTTTFASESAPVSPDAALLVPGIAVQAWMRTGENISLGTEGYKEGRLLARGATVGDLGGASFTRTTSPTGTVLWHDVVDSQGRHNSVYEFVLDMAWEPGVVIPARGGFNVQLAVYLDNEFCTDSSNRILTPSVLVPYGSEDLVPRMDLAVFDALRIEYLQPTLFDDELVIFASANSLFGNYDVDERTEGVAELAGGLSLAIEGPSATTSLRRGGIIQRYTEYDHHYEAVDVWYLWDTTQDGAQPGTYTVRFTARNDQGSATASAVATFTIGDEVRVTGCLRDEGNATVACREQVATPDGELADPPAKQTPAPFLGLVAAFGVAAFFASRRR